MMRSRRETAARERFAIEMKVHAAASGGTHPDSPGVGSGTAENKFVETIGGRRRAACSPRDGDATASAVAEETAEFSGDAAGRELMGVNVGADNQNLARRTPGNQGAGNGEPVEQAEACAPDVENSAGVAREKPRMKLRAERGISERGLAGDDEEIEVGGLRARPLQRRPRGDRGQVELVFRPGGEACRTSGQIRFQPGQRG